jgi:putative iron-dependent peroxidase
MPQPQAGIIPEPSELARFLILRVREPAAAGPAIATHLGRVPSLADKVGALDRGAKLVCTVSIGPEFWDVVSPRRRPKSLRPFKVIEVSGKSAPNTGGDLLFHIISKRADLNFELATRLMKELSGLVEVMDDVAGFRYLDSRDLTGFIDGTENPKGRERAGVALIGNEDPVFAAGSYVFTQRYVHNLARWATIAVKEQEGAIGRRKRDSKELSERAKQSRTRRT